MPLQDWADLSPSAITISADDTGMADVWQPVMAGPDSTGLNWSQQPNVLKGRLRVQNTTGDPYVLIDPSQPEISLYEGGSRVARLGDLGSSYYGLDIGSDPPTSGGVRMTASDLTGYNTSGQQRFQIVYGGANQGDITCGNYSGDNGFQWDESAGIFDIRGTLHAQDITAGVHVGRTFLTAGSYLTAATEAGDTTIYVGDNSDFPNGGTGWIYGVDGEKDAFTYTGKSSEGLRLTGCVGVGDHISGLAVMGEIKSMIIDRYANEMHFYGDQGDGDIINLASIGISQVGSDYFILKVGSYYTDCSRVAGGFYSKTGIALIADSYSNYGISASSALGIGIYGVSGIDSGVKGSSTNGYGGEFYGHTSSKAGVYGHGYYGAYLCGDYMDTITKAGGAVQLKCSNAAGAPTHSALKGTLWPDANGVLYINIDGSTGWQKVGSQ